MKDCTTCKYGYKDERLGIPMCHHPKRFSEDCIDFNMHEEKEIKESEKPVPNALEEAAEEYARKYGKGAMGGAEYTKQDFIAGANWQRKQDHDACYQCEKNYDTVFFRGEQHAIKMLKEEAVAGEIMKSYSGALVAKTIHCIDEGKFKFGDKVKIIILKDE